MKTFKVPTIWGEEPDPPEAPSTPIQLPIPEKIIPWQQLQIAQNEHFMRFTKNRTIEVLGKLYEPVLGEIDWEMEGIYNCRVKGNICYGKDYQDLRSLTTHLQGQMHRVVHDTIFESRLQKHQAATSPTPPSPPMPSTPSAPASPPLPQIIHLTLDGRVQ